MKCKKRKMPKLENHMGLEGEESGRVLIGE
jgi:hypothetical protein